jgi:FMN phosphatase YigB (HAD superfamily)
MGACFPAFDEVRLVRSIVKAALDAQISQAYRAYQHGTINREAFWERVGIDANEGESELARRFKPMPGARETIAYLKRKNYKVIALTDAPQDWVRLLVTTNRMQGLFDRLVHANELGGAMKHANVYALLAKQYGDCIFVDSQALNLETASRAGMRTALVGPIGMSAFQPDMTAASITELQGAL